MITYLIIINILAAIGLIAIMFVIDEIKVARKIKKERERKEQMRKDILEIIDEVMEDKNA